MKKVLIVSYYFPPLNNITARLVSNLASNMEKFGWQPFVLTTESEGDLPSLIPEENIIRIGRHCDSGKRYVSEERYRGIPAWLKIPYFLYKSLKMEFRSFDRFLFSWVKDSLKQTEKIREINPDFILATSYPASSIWLGRILAKKLKKPWVADFRDPMSLYNQSRFPFVKSIDGLIDKLLVNGASLIVTIGPTLARLMEGFYKKPVYVIYNGFDANLIQPAEEKPMGNDKIIYYAGRFHSHRLPAVKLLIDCLARKNDEKIILKIRSLGPKEANEEIADYVKKRNVSSKVQLLEPASPEFVLKEEKAADILAIFENLDRSNALEGAMTGKLFEYLPFKAPILAIALPDSDMGLVLRNAAKGCLVSNAEQTDKALEDILEGKFSNPDWQKVKEYSFQNQAQILCQLLNQKM